MKVHSNRSVRRAKVIPDGKNLVSHAGAALLAELADRSGLTEAMSVAMEDCGISWHTHDPGVVLTHLAVAIADGADCLADIAALKEQEDLFGPVASVATAWRAVHATASVELRAIPVAMATARARVWAAHPPEGPMIWDFDCRRERPHPGAQLSLFDTHAGWRHTCFITNTEGDDITALELRHRGHARVEDRVRAWKACGLANLPFDGFCANEAWVAVSLIAGALLAWSQMTCFEGALAKAEPKTMRYRVLHVAAVLAHRGRDLIVHLNETWPWASELDNAFTRLRAAFP